MHTGAVDLQKRLVPLHGDIDLDKIVDVSLVAQGMRELGIFHSENVPYVALAYRCPLL